MLTLPQSADPLALPWEADTLPRQRFAEHGAVIVPDLIPQSLTNAYRLAYAKAHVYPVGWSHCTPYADVPEVRDLCLYPPLVEMIEHLMGEAPLLHLNLTGWVSSERQWHQDTYLNPRHVGDYYLAVWIALDDIHPDAGPFEFVPDSHRWPVLTRDALFAELTPEQRVSSDWPRFTEPIVAPLYEAEIERRGVTPEQFIAQRGDVLFWHGRTVHRGSTPRDPARARRSLIAHYSGVNHREDMPTRVQQGDAWWFDPGDHRQPA